MIPPDQFADLIAQASDEQLAEGMASNRDVILQEIFNRWPDQFRSDAARDVKATDVLHATVRDRWDAPGPPPYRPRSMGAFKDGVAKASFDATMLG